MAIFCGDAAALRPDGQSPFPRIRINQQRRQQRGSQERCTGAYKNNFACGLKAQKGATSILRIREGTAGAGLLSVRFLRCHSAVPCLPSPAPSRRATSSPTPLSVERCARSQARAQRRANPTRGTGGLASRSGTKRPNSKWKLLAKLADNIFHSTKPYRCPDAARLARQWCLLLTAIFPWSGRFLTKHPKAKARGSPITTLRTTPDHRNCPSDA